MGIIVRWRREGVTYHAELGNIVRGAFPPVTAFMSAYDGSLPGLLALTVGAGLFCGVRASIKQIQLRRSRK